jgi:hypothetical protein
MIENIPRLTMSQTSKMGRRQATTDKEQTSKGPTMGQGQLGLKIKKANYGPKIKKKMSPLRQLLDQFIEPD